MRLNKIYSLILVLFTVSTIGFGKDPLGETADYKLDKDPNRTMSMIKNGTVKTSVVALHESTSVGPAYEVHMDYTFNVSFVGNQTGTQKEMLEAKFFTDEFIEQLRKDKHYESTYFKADHLGYADAKNLDGKFYPHCDKVLLYDLKNPPQFMTELFADIVDANREDIQDLKTLVHLYAGIPALGAAKVDVSGKYQGMNVKAGGDYMAK